ncbi:MAG: NeuD/PglB/VioB family sugar acetyltransferase [Hyphomicrobiales bacterium]|nr:NeuD/PglB/VioB family sugar acetyltransferase [Hyphomicrobiales bacterium]
MSASDAPRDAPRDAIACLVLGGGGHGKVVLEALLAAPGVGRLGVLDVRPGTRGQSVMGVPILGDDGFLARAGVEGYTHFVCGVGAAGDNPRRVAVFDKGVAAGLQPLAVCHPAAVVSSHAGLGAGAVVLAAAVVNPGAAIGANAIVNTAAVVEHDCVVGEHVHLAPRCCLLGGVKVGAGAVIGAGAIVRQGVGIGENAVVAAGAVVVRDVPAGGRVAGIPAKAMRPAS